MAPQGNKKNDLAFFFFFFGHLRSYKRVFWFARWFGPKSAGRAWKSGYAVGPHAISRSIKVSAGASEHPQSQHIVGS